MKQSRESKNMPTHIESVNFYQIEKLIQWKKESFFLSNVNKTLDISMENNEP